MDLPAKPYDAIEALQCVDGHQRYQVPIGLIETSWGGTVAEAWVSVDGLKSFPEFPSAIEEARQTDGASVIAAVNVNLLPASATIWIRHFRIARGK